LQNYERQIEIIVNYFRRNEKKEQDFKLGIEFEHFIIDKESLRAITYYEDGGVQDTLKQLLKKGWKGKYEGEYLLGLERDGTTVTLEPGAQVELSIKPYKEIKHIEREYIDFLEEIIPILDKKGQQLIAVGYQPESKIEDIPFIPKSRYKYMSEYFESRGSLAHNMMKGTASLQVTLDYKSEVDYMKKFTVANALSPIISAIFDNGPFFEGRIWDKNNIRTKIWLNCDSDRCGVVNSLLDPDEEFSYKKYAEYILNTPPILIDDGKNVKYTGDTPYRELFDVENYTMEELEHVFTMVFPDVRLKKFIEIRMTDEVPYPLNFAGAALWKGLLYNEKNLNKLYNLFIDISIEDINKAKLDAIEHGVDGKMQNKAIYDIGKMIVGMAKEGLNEGEKKYLYPLENIVYSRKTPAKVTKEKLHLGKHRALDWCILNKIPRSEMNVCK
jgi:glutamate--cysteine ligase